jgi:hypothetical protein
MHEEWTRASRIDGVVANPGSKTRVVGAGGRWLRDAIADFRRAPDSVIAGADEPFLGAAISTRQENAPWATHRFLDTDSSTTTSWVDVDAVIELLPRRCPDRLRDSLRSISRGVAGATP